MNNNLQKNTNEYENMHLTSEMPYVANATKGEFGNLGLHTTSNIFQTITIGGKDIATILKRKKKNESQA